jgi:3-hydroxyisobutyryl-CoA hydrolase
MQANPSKSLKRLQATCGFLKNFKKNFSSDNNTNEAYDGILYKNHSKFVSEVTLNSPKNLNSLDLKMIKTFLKRVRHWVPNVEMTSASETEDMEQKNVREVPKILIMTGAGEKAFCAGGDVKSLYLAKVNDGNDKLVKDFFRYEYLLDYSLSQMETIQIALWNGIVMGGGVGLSQNAPIRVATDNTVWAMPGKYIKFKFNQIINKETAIGLFPDVGATWWLPRVCNNDHKVGLYLGLTGDKLKGKDLAYSGIATHYVPKDKFESLKKDIIEKSNGETNLENLKEIVESYSEVTYSAENFTFPNIHEIHRTFHIDSMEELHNRLTVMLENGSDSEKLWAKKTLNTLKRVSQISQAVVLEQIKRGINLKSIEDAYNLEAQLVAA